MGSDAKYEVEESARLVLSQVNQLSFATGVFIGEDGEIFLVMTWKYLNRINITSTQTDELF